jgi:hypothetical protein
MSHVVGRRPPAGGRSPAVALPAAAAGLTTLVDQLTSQQHAGTSASPQQRP